jgi:hypothetical protein
VGGGSTAGGSGGAAGAAGAAAGASAVTTGAVIAAAFPIAYIIGFIVAGEINKALEAAKDLQSLLISKTPSARGLNWFEVMVLKAELDRWGVPYVERSYRDPRTDTYVRGSSVVVKVGRTQLVDVLGTGAPGSSSSADYALVSRYASKAVLRARQAALEFLSWRGFWAGRIARQWPGAARLAADAYDVPPGPSYDYLEPGLGGLGMVPDPFSGPRAWPVDPQSPAPSLAELQPSGGGIVPAVDCPDAVIAFARLTALLEVLSVAKRIWPQDDAPALARRVAGAQEVSSIFLDAEPGGWRLRSNFWGPFEGSTVALSLAWSGGSEVVALVPEAQREAPKQTAAVQPLGEPVYVDVRKLVKGKGTAA